MNPRGHLLKQTVVTLCVALMLVFNLAAASAAVNQVQHLPGAPENHQHMTFSNPVMEDHHDDHHAGGDHHEAVVDPDQSVAAQEHHDHDAPANTAKKSLAGENHHHHHGDIGPSVVILAASVTDPLPLWDRDKHSGADSVRISVRRSLPERPPRTAFISV